MTSTLQRPGPAPAPYAGHGRALDRVPLVLALAVVLLRLPALAAAPGADEAGFLVVARHWAPGTSLYGDYWVDRPPLLITIFHLADVLGGIVALRAVGAVAAALVVLGTAAAARRVVALRPGADPAGASRAAAGAALAAAALCLSPVVGATEVNGELLAAPFTAWGLVALLSALRARRPRRAALGAGLAGACLVAAVLVKQNLLDLGVFAGAFLLLAVLRRELAPARALRLTGWAGAGAAVTGGAVAAWTVLHGTSLVGVWDAMYPFRVAAGRLLAASPNPRPGERRVHLAWLALLSGVPLVVLVALGALAARRLRDTAVVALLATLAFGVVSIVLGGSYWSHYLVELVVPVAVLAGLLLAARVPGAGPAVGLVVACALVAWAVAPPPARTPTSSLGAAIRTVAHRGDTVVTLYGHAEVTEASGLGSPYPYLWSLPMRVRDPHGALLARTLDGPRAPTWFVVLTRLHEGPAGATARAVADHYHRVALLDGHSVYLHDGLHRAAPSLHRPTTEEKP